MQGMSGSPVYVDGKLIGAVAMAFPFAKDPITGIRPIEEMLRVSLMPGPAAAPRRSATSDLASLFPRPAQAGFGESRMVAVATPISLSGFTSQTADRFLAGLQALGLEPRQGISVGGAPEMRLGDPSKLQPGSMISVELMTGDMSVGADGTVTCVDGDKVYAFGHRFLAVGPTDLPFTRSEVMTLLANVNTSFKISSARELMGVISQDRDTGIAGTLGRRATMLPLDITVAEGAANAGDYHMQMVNDRFLSPFLLQMAVFSSMDATERTTGASTIEVQGSVEFENRRETASLRNIYAADTGAPMQAATLTAVPLSYLMQAGFEALKIKHIGIRIAASNTKKDMNIAQVYLSRKEARPGDTVELMTLLDGPNGVELTRSVKYTIPPGTAPGTLYFTVADGNQTSIAELRQIVAETPASVEQLISTVNRVRPNDKAYIRIWRAEPAYEVQGEELPDPPPSLALILGSTQSLSQNRNSRVAEIVLDAGNMLVSGAKTAQLEVKD
jgi:hypothetical protein